MTDTDQAAAGWDARGLHRRLDGRLEVDATDAANGAFGCTMDDWCILVDGHDGDCNDDRELDPSGWSS